MISPGLKYLLMSRVEFIDAIKNELGQNPFLEEFSNLRSVDASSCHVCHPQQSPEFRPAAGMSLSEYLTLQLNMAQIVDSDRAIAREIIGALDDNGFLSGNRPCEEIAIRLTKQTQDAGLYDFISVDHVERVLSLMQSFDPIGVAARDLKECLLIQLRHQGNENHLAAKMIGQYMTELEKHFFQDIANEEEVPLEEVAAAMKIIQRLEPRPARNFGVQNSIYITPDIYVNKVGDEYAIAHNDDDLPMLRISKNHQESLADALMTSEAKCYVQENLRSAQWLVRSIRFRRLTIKKVMESILKLQKDFFEKGVGHLKPLVLRDVAVDIGVHESTISRATSNKYVHTPQGIFELKYFFSSSIGRSVGCDVSSASVKQRIKHLIEGEERNRPYSDQAIVAILKEENITIARRTVAKFRSSMGYLRASRRRSLLPISSAA